MEKEQAPLLDCFPSALPGRFKAKNAIEAYRLLISSLKSSAVRNMNEPIPLTLWEFLARGTKILSVQEGDAMLQTTLLILFSPSFSTRTSHLALESGSNRKNPFSVTTAPRSVPFDLQTR